MPYDGSNVWTLPANTAAVSGAAIQSTKFNSITADLESALNDLRYQNLNIISDLQTFLGSASLASARTNLSAVAYASQSLSAANQGIARANISAALKGHIHGLTLSNNGSDATNDIDIAVGEAASTETDPVLMVLASALTKRLDASWAVGTAQGGLDTGSIANATYHIWLIQRSDTGVVDALFSTSASSPTMPSGYDRKRRIGSIVRTGAAIKAFKQNGDLFSWLAGVNDVSASNPGTSAVTRTLSVPTGIKVLAQLGWQVFTDNSGIPEAIRLYDLDLTDAAAAPANLTGYWYGPSGAFGGVGATTSVMTNTSGQIGSRIQVSSTSVTVRISTHGWIDTRGKDA